MHAVNVACRKTTENFSNDVTNNMQFAYRQANELRLNSFFILTTLLSSEQLIHLDYFTWRRVGWQRDGFLVASWLVAKLPGGEMTG